MSLSFTTPPGLFISFEGIDGAGKSTHIEALAREFAAQGRVVTQTREPGGTALAEKLRSIFLNDPMDAMTEALLVFAARRDHLQQVIEPALARGEVVLCDRFTDATFAYQGGGRGFDLGILAELERMVQTVPGLRPDAVRQPDLTLWFDLSPEVAAVRLASARVPDKFEAQPAAFFARVRTAYAARAASHAQRFVRINADDSRAQVWQAVLTAVQGRGWLQ
jgi:dTMP kinase